LHVLLAHAHPLALKVDVSLLAVVSEPLCVAAAATAAAGGATTMAPDAAAALESALRSVERVLSVVFQRFATTFAPPLQALLDQLILPVLGALLSNSSATASASVASLPATARQALRT